MRRNFKKKNSVNKTTTNRGKSGRIKKTKFFLIVLISVSFSLSFFIPLNKSEYTSLSSESDILDPDSIKTQALIYTVSNYVVTLEINGLDIQAQINITYDVTYGTKYSGFKRFLCPEIFPLISLAYISESSIEIYDENDVKLNYDYREFQGKDWKHYKEIKFYHAGFTGTKTFSMNFLMKNWIIEHFGSSDIHLPNIGTFSIPVERAEYILIFPENHVITSVYSGAGGSEDTEKIENQYVYTLIQNNDISNDVSIKTLPNITNTIPWQDIYWIFMIALIFIIVIIAGFIIHKVYLYYENMPEEEKQRRRALKEKRRAERQALGGCGGCGGCGGGCGGCGGGGCGGCGG